MDDNVPITRLTFAQALYIFLIEPNARELSRRLEDLLDMRGIWNTLHCRHELLIAVAFEFGVILRRDVAIRNPARLLDVPEIARSSILSGARDEGATGDDVNQLDSVVLTRLPEYTRVLGTDANNISEDNLQRFAHAVFLNTTGAIESNPTAERAIAAHFMFLLTNLRPFIPQQPN